MGMKNLEGIEFPKDSCEFSPSKAHHFTKVVCNIWRCKYCWASKYLPGSYGAALEFSINVRRRGLRGTYRKLLENKLQTIKVLEQLRGFCITRRVTRAKTIEGLEAGMLLDIALNKAKLAAMKREQSISIPQPEAKKLMDDLAETDIEWSRRRVPLAPGIE